MTRNKTKTKKQPASTSTQVSIRMDPKLRKQLEHEAKEQGRTLSQFIRFVLIKWTNR